MSCTVEVWRQVITLIWEEERGWDRLWFERGGGYSAVSAQGILLSVQ